MQIRLLYLSLHFQVFISIFVSNPGSSPCNNPLLVSAYCHTTTFLQRVLPAVCDCLQPITSCPRNELPTTLKVCSIIGITSCATLQRSAYFECISTSCRYQSVISRIRNVLLSIVGPEWKSLWFGLICTLFCGNSCSEFKLSHMAVSNGARRTLPLGVVLGTSLGRLYSSSSLDKIYES